jgi:alpha-L-fucosidase 2
MMTAVSCVGQTQALSTGLVKVDVNWAQFIGRHDLIWDALPDHFDYGAFLGNGMLGSTIHQDGPQRLRWEMGRSDVTEHRRDNARLPIGGLVLTTIGAIKESTMRMDLWNAELRGTIRTDKGHIRFRSFIHTHEMVMAIDLQCDEGETGAAFTWEPRPCVDHRNVKRFQDPPNPPHLTKEINGMPICIQSRFAGGEYATAYNEFRVSTGRRIILSIADSFPQRTAAQQAVATVETVTNMDYKGLISSHRTWWHGFYPKNMVSVPDPKLESFYWIQWYKLASASRPHRVPVDLLGPWYRKTSWPRIWWNLNIETLYLPVYTGNRLELGESFVNFMDAKRDNFYRNAKDIWGFDGCATVSHTTCYEGLRGNGSAAPDKYINPGDFTWALHNYFLHYRYSMDHSLVTDQSKHAFYPLLRDSITLYLKILEPGDDGKLHLPKLHSPEYGDDRDNNYNLSLLRWGCQTLLDLNRRYNLKDPLVPTWQQTLKDLVPYPVDANGLRLGADISITKSHRHWSHILMVHPLHIMTGDQPENRKLLEKSVLHWLTVDKSRGINGWSRAAAASLYATLGDGDNAIKQIHGHMADKRFVRPNTMYIEGSPVIECAIILNRSLQDMLLQSWGGKINVFAAIPKEWDSTVFHDLRAEGAFLVSAKREQGRTAWVRIKSLAGEPCRVQPNFGTRANLLINGKSIDVVPTPAGIYELPLGTGDEAVLYRGETVPGLTIRPLPAAPEDVNPFGGVRRLKPSLSTGSTATASSTYSKTYAPSMAVDNDPTTRWAGAHGTRNAWLEINLPEKKTVTRVVIHELQFPSTQAFTVECDVSGAWQEVARGTTIAGMKKLSFSPVTTRRIRLNLLKTVDDVPTIGEFQVF